MKRYLSRAGQLGALGAAVIRVAVQNEQYQSWSAEEIQTAKRTAYVGFLHREPFVIDAFRLGFAVGIREDYTFQSSLRNVDVPVEILDNDFRNPDLDRYIERFERYEPQIGILGDAYSREEARRYTKAARELKDKFDDVETVIVPKCPEAIEAIDDDVVLGYPMGYSDLLAEDYSNIVDWRGRRVHLLGASPAKQYEMIQGRTQPRVTGEPPADIVGCDWNGVHLAALKGQYFTPHGYSPADHLSIRETVRQSLEWIRRFWESVGVWPLEGEETCPLEAEPDDRVLTVDGRRADGQNLEDAIVVKYEDGITRTYRTERERARIEYRAGLTGDVICRPSVGGGIHFEH